MQITQEWVSQQTQESLLISAWQRLVDLMAELCDTPAGFIVQASSTEYKVVIANNKPENPYRAGSAIDANVNIFCRKVVAINAPVYEGAATENPEWQDNPEVSDDGFNTYLGYPLHWPDGSVFGTICVMDFAKSDYDQRYTTLLEHFRDMAEKELELCDKNLQLKSIAYSDDLTKVMNRKGFFENSKSLLATCNEQPEVAHIYYFDIDNLKPINDSYGHRVGDEIIQRFAEYLTQIYQQDGIIARFGGDEFVVLILGEAGEDRSKLQQLYQLVSNQETSPKLKFSTGYAAKAFVNADIAALEQLIGEADKQMYLDKARQQKT